MASFSDNSWTIYEAMVEMFFSGFDTVRRDDAYKHKLIKAITESVKSPHCRDFSSLLESHHELANQVSITLRSVVGKWSKDLPPFKWVRLANQLSNQNVLPICSQFFRGFGEWRFDTEREKGPIVLVVKQRPLKVGSKHKVKTMTLDQFILDPKVSDEDEWEIEYRPVEIVAKDIKIKTKNTKPRSTSDIVGAHVFSALKECVEKVACGEVKIVGFSRKKVRSRYVFKGTRKKLVELLKNKFPRQLMGSDSALVQAVSDLVACGRYSTKKRITANSEVLVAVG